MDVYARDLYKSVDDVCMYLKRQMEIEAEKWAQLAGQLHAMQAHIGALSAHPYVATTQLLSPQGLPLRVTIATTNPDSVRTASEFVTAQLVDIGCKVLQP
jgi:hypothetical protein